MSETQVLLSKIAALRQRLEQAQGLIRDAGSTAARTVQAFPEAPSAQIRLCAGLEVILGIVADRLASLTAALAARRREHGRIDALANLLGMLATGHPVEMAPLTSLAEAVLDDA